MMKLLFTILLLIPATVIGFSQSINSQTLSTDQVIGIPWHGEKGVTETVSQISKREEVTPKLPFAIRPKKEEYHLPKKNQQNPLAPAVSQWPPLDGKSNVQEAFGVTSSQTVGTSFLGVEITETPGYIPPDCNGDVGPTQILMHVNGRIKVFNKNGTVGPLDVLDNTFWTSVRNGSDVCDPHVRYDRISGRWFIVVINMPASGANRILIAMSSGPTITGSSSFTFFQFQNDLVGTTPNVDAGAFADYPTLGVDANALYIGANMFDGTTSAFIGTSVFVVRKADLLTGTLTVTPFRRLTNGSTTGPFTPQGVHNDDPSATEGYFIGVDAVAFSKLIIRRVSNPSGTPSLSGNIELTVPTTTYPIPQVVLGSASNRRLDGLDDRPFAAQLKKNKITGEVSLWTAQNIEVNSSGVGVSGGGRNGSRWYEIVNLSTTPTLKQSGTLFSSATTSPRGYWIPSVAANGQGHMALGCSYASSNDYAGVVVSGRLNSDALGSTQAPTIAQTSSTAYNIEANDNQRWGDYSQVVVDPADDMTMWTFQEYCNASNSWGMRIIQLIAPPPATPISVAPVTVNTGSSNVLVTLTGTSTSGSGFYDPGAGYPNRLAAVVNGGGVTVNSITFTNPTTITLNISIDAGAVTGARTITVTNPDGQTSTSATGILTIVNSSCPVITITPATLADGSLGISYSQTVTAGGGTAPYTYSVTTGTLPAGITCSTDGVISGIPTTAGVYNFSVTASDQNLCTGTQAYSLLIGGCSSISLSPTSLSNGMVGSVYEQTITSSGGNSPYQYSISNGSLPSGLTLSSSGLLSGTPGASGTFTFTITSLDASLCAGNQIYNLIINPSPGNSISLTSMGISYIQGFNSLALSGTSSSMPIGWMFTETGTNANTLYTAGNGSGSAGDCYSLGTTSSSDRAFGGLLSSSLVPIYGASFTNNTGSTITSLVISYAGEEWRLGTTGRADTIQFQLSTNATSLTTGVYTRDSRFDFATPVITGTIGAFDGNAVANRRVISDTIKGLSISDGAVFFIKWTDYNATGADDALAIDDFSITPLGVSLPTNPSIIGSVTPTTIYTAQNVLITGMVTAGTNPASSSLIVIGDLTAIGGSSLQPLFDDGTHGDLTNGDNIFSFQHTLPSGVSTGIKQLFITVSDAQSRSNVETIDITVVSPPCPDIIILPSVLPNDSVGEYYIQNISAEGGTPPYSFSLVSGNLPDGVSLTSTGSLAGILSKRGSFNFIIRSIDSNGCVAEKPYSISVLQTTEVVQIPVLAKWNLISNPAGVVNDSLYVLFPGATTSAYRYTTTGYQSSQKIERGFGYWLKFASPETVTVEGKPYYEDSIDVIEGWNLIGSLTREISTSSITGVGTTILSNFFKYDDGYIFADTVSPGKGYWVKVSPEGKLHLMWSISPVAATVRSNQLSESKNNMNEITFEQLGQKRSLYFGVKNEEMESRFELPPSPPEGVFDVRFKSQRFAETYSSNIGKQLQYPIQISGASNSVDIKWNSAFVADEIVKLQIQESGKKTRNVKLAGNGEIKINDPNNTKLILILSDRSEIPTVYKLHQNYPNPFNPVTSIAYELPVESKVHLSVYNILGELVAIIVDDLQDEGYHSSDWDAGNIASGVYFYKLEAVGITDYTKSFVQIKKMLLAK